MTMHNDAQKGEIAERIVLVGDPNRAKMIAEEYLENAILVNEKRYAYCYTGTYQGTRVSVMGVGMGAPSMMIYATELCRDYGCKYLVRVGTSGGFLPEMKNFDIVLSEAVSTTGGINNGLFSGHFSPCADFFLLKKSYEVAEEMGLRVYVGPTIANDRLYRDESYQSEKWKRYGMLASEQEGEAFYTAAAEYGAKALMMVGIVCGIRVGDDGKESFVDLEEGSPSQTMHDMVKLALRTVTEI